MHRSTLSGSAPDGSKLTFRAVCSDLPDGVFVAGLRSEEDKEPHLLWHEQLWAWRPGGYEKSTVTPEGRTVAVLTPRSIVNALGAGFVPAVAL